MSRSPGRPSLVRTVFLWLGAIGVCANFVMDVTVHDRATKAGRARVEREATFRDIMHLYRAEDALRAHDRARAEAELANLGGNPAIRPVVDALARGEWTAAAHGAEALQTAGERALENNFVTDDQRWRSHLVVRTLTLDVALICVLLTLALIDYKSRERTEHHLRGSIRQLRGVGRGMEEKLRQIRIKNRTLVHNLKNPVGSIMGFAELLREQSASPATIECHSVVIERLSRTALDLVEALLTEDLGESPPGQPVEVARVLLDARLAMEGLAHAKEQTIVDALGGIDRDARVLGNGARLGEVVANLLGNAIKYSPVGGTIWLTARSTGADIVVDVEDQGPGFTEEDRARAFGYGQTLSARPTGGEASTGYGLFVARQIVAEHGGRIAIDDATRGPGARITFTLPRADQSRALSI